MDRRAEVTGFLNGNFLGDGFGPVSGWFSAKAISGMAVITNEAHLEIARFPSIRLTASPDSTFELFQVTIGNRFHWERMEDQTFLGDLILWPRHEAWGRC